MFVDKVTISLKAGNGGNGYVSFRQEKFVDRGGPDGGDGGDGGDVVVVASNSENTLARFRFDKIVHAEDGKGGFKQKMHGKRAKVLEVHLPVGTVVTDEEGEIRADLTHAGQRVRIAEGGKGGFGNAHFISSSRQAPKFAELGEQGESYTAVFELKMIADVGLIGLPNAGKSTFLSVVSNAKPEIANYPFTTLVPNLGVTSLDSERSMLIADIPGLIEGASEGKGLGDEFLRHVERTSVLIHCIDAYSENPVLDYKTIKNELKAYSVELSKRPEIVVLTKIEGLDKEIIEMQLSELKKVVKKGTKVFLISAQAHIGMKDVLEAAYSLVENARKVVVTEQAEELTIIKPEFKEMEWKVEPIEEGVYMVVGRKMERFAMRTDVENEEALRRLRDILKKKGVFHELSRKGAKRGATIVFGKNRQTSITF